MNRRLVLSRYRATTGSNTERQLGIGGASTETLKTNFVKMSELRMNPTDDIGGEFLGCYAA